MRVRIIKTCIDSAVCSTVTVMRISAIYLVVTTVLSAYNIPFMLGGYSVNFKFNLLIISKQGQTVNISKAAYQIGKSLALTDQRAIN